MARDVKADQLFFVGEQLIFVPLRHVRKAFIEGDRPSLCPRALRGFKRAEDARLALGFRALRRHGLIHRAIEHGGKLRPAGSG